MTNDIPILEGEEMWASEAIDYSGWYKVCYYRTALESSVDFKWFKTLKEATDFAIKHPATVLEIKRYQNAS
jgi:hypothetical protein